MDDLKHDKCDIVVVASINTPLPKQKNTHQLLLPNDYLGLVIKDELYERYNSVKDILKSERLIQYCEALAHPAFNTLKLEMQKYDFDYSIACMLDNKDVHRAVINGLGVSFIPESLTHYPDFGAKELHFIKKPLPVEMNIHQCIYFKQERYSDFIDITKKIKGEAN
ncbi:hypothetical protein BHU62_11995 [Serratia marcescens]|uniref:LysR substrate-binding domain-containing protein n=2 Tax=Serratia marcescens TaxID=615 RepID=A0A1Q4P0C4_SERMA|nr:hypothetical protein BHU62_11995 [Serratia marcescens]